MRRIMIALLVCGTCGSWAGAKIVTETVDYAHDGTRLLGYLAYDDALTGQRPGVLVVHEWWGLNDFAKEKARALAKEGYVAFAVDMYGVGKLTDAPEQASQWAGALYSNAKLWRARARAGYAQLAGHARVDERRIGAIGFCFGGSTVLQMAYAGIPLRGVVSFHGGLVLPEKQDLARTRARILVLHGAADTLVPDQELTAFMDALRPSKVDWHITIYSGAKHSFTNPDADQLGMEGVGYDAAAARRSWAHMHMFFSDVLEAGRK